MLVVTKTAVYQEVNKHLLKYLIEERNIPGIYITLNKPYETVKKSLEIDTKALIFVDTEQKHLEVSPKKKKDVYS